MKRNIRLVENTMIFTPMLKQQELFLVT